MKIVLAITLLLTLYACGTSNTTKTFTPEEISNDSAVVYVYRPFSVSNVIYSPDLYVNGEVRTALKSNSKYFFKLPPGENTFEIEPEKNYAGTPKITLSLTAHSIYYLRVDTTLKIKSAVNYEPYKRGFSLVEIENEHAVQEITQCCADKEPVEKTMKTTVIETDNKTNDKGFSVDKTQNPFSHKDSN